MESASDVSPASPFVFLDRHLFNDEDQTNLNLIQASEEKNMEFSAADNNLISDLAASGLEGLSAAAAIISMKKYKVRHSFERDPFKRRRKKTQLLRKLRGLVQDYIFKFGKHVVFMAVSPRFNGFKIFGTDTLMKAVIEIKTEIISEFKTALNEETFYMTSPKFPPHFPLPLLTVEGLPTTIDKLTQGQLRTFIPHMIKCSTKRSKIGWGYEETKPVWWPAGLPWASIRSDTRPQKEKEKMSWTEVLRQIVVDCYRYHGKERFLYSFGKSNQEESTCDNSLESSTSKNVDESEYQEIELPKYRNISEQENQNQNHDVNYCDCTNVASCVEEDTRSNDISTIFIKNETTVHHSITESCERVNISDVETTENFHNKEDEVEITTNVVETSFNCTSTIENFGNVNEYLPCPELNQSNEVEYIYDATSLVTVDPNNTIFLDMRGCTHGQLTYVIPLVSVQPVEINQGETLETFAFAQNDMATHSLVVQVNGDDNLFLN